MELTKRIRTEIREYLRNTIDYYDERVELALDKIGDLRCDLSYADPDLYCQIIDKMHDWADENGYCVNDYDESEINPDEIIMY